MLHLSRIGLYARTLRHLKPVQLTNRVRRQLFRPGPDLSPPPARRDLNEIIAPWIARPDSVLGPLRFQFLNQTRDLDFPPDWNAPDTPKLWLYNLHYFEGLLCPDTDPALKTALITRWFTDNPPGAGNGWEPYPASLRIVNWIKWTLSEGTLSQSAVHSLAIQTRYLVASLEYHLLGNHLFANAKALVFAGCFFEGDEADSWLIRGQKILKNQIPEQFLQDGGHFELSTTYHALLTEDLFDIIHMMRLANQVVPENQEKVAHKALDWMTIMTRPDGLSPLFNDAAYGIAPTRDALNTYANALGFRPPNPVTSGLTDMPDSGYFRFEGCGYSLFGDAGPIGPDCLPGHAHCDIGNFELFADGLPVIVDTGTSTYEAGARRHEERSTSAHNVVQVAGLEQSEIWSAFRVGRRARITGRQAGNASVDVAHDGFKSTGVMTRRNFEMAARVVTITDTLTGPDRDAVARLHFHPDVCPRIEGDRVTAGPLNLTFDGASGLALCNYNYAEEFNRCIPAWCLEVTFNRTVTTRIAL